MVSDGTILPGLGLVEPQHCQTDWLLVTHSLSAELGLGTTHASHSRSDRGWGGWSLAKLVLSENYIRKFRGEGQASEALQLAAITTAIPLGSTSFRRK
jgi:hypothetical protein